MVNQGVIVLVSDRVELHPSGRDWAVVRNGAVYGTYDTQEYALAVATDLVPEDEAGA